MTRLNNHLEVYKLLPQTNCRQCGLPTCLAFAVAVMQGQKRLADCPPLDGEVAAQYEVKSDRPSAREDDYAKALAELRGRMASVDLASSAQRLGASLAGGKLVVSVLGKPFTVDAQGVITSDCHTNPWVSIPLLSYVIGCRGREPKGEWVPLRDLPGGKDWYRLFGQRCEIPFKKVADNYTDLFEDMIDVFDAKPAPDAFDSDIAVVVHPLPRLPVLICYWKPEDGLESTINLFFDAAAEDNLNIESIYTLGVGMVTMFERIALTHGK